jgi:cytochrome c oxidase subunit I+III
MSTVHPRTGAAELHRVWASPPTLRGWLGMVNHKSIGKRFLVTGAVFFAIGGLFALIVRLQLAWPGLELIDPQTYNEIFTMHGVTMAFLFIVPILEGFAIFVLPLMVGARDLPFPRLTAFGYWVYLLAGVFLYASFLVDVPDGGWYAYVPFTGPDFSPTFGMDFWLLGVTFLEISAIAAGIEIIALLFKNRAPGMSISRMPLFAWAMLVTAFIILFAFPTLIVGSILLELDRKLGSVFYNPDVGGSAVLWQHLFWWFGHPDVYIWLLPGMGVVSMVISTFARTKLVGYTWVVAATIVIGVLSFGVWVHHMFTVGLPLLTISFFGGASLVFALASGVQVFAWIATIWRGRVVWSTAMLYAVGSVLVFVFGGLSGVTLGVVPFNWLAHDTYYVVAHFHYVVLGGSVLPMFAAAYYWWPTLTGRALDERLGRWNFWLFMIGTNLTFLPLHVVGLLGMPRRIYTFLPGLGWDLYNLFATVGMGIAVIGFAVFVWNAFKTQRAPPAAPNLWQAGTLEWAVPTPVPNHNFTRFPVVRSRYPLWDQDTLDATDAVVLEKIEAVSRPRNQMREVLVTTEVDADLQSIVTLPQQSQWPWITALAIAISLVGVLFDIYWLALLALAGTVVCCIGWAWPNRDYDPIEDR